jgi:hypothetical protein
MFWILLSGNAEVAFPSGIAAAANLPDTPSTAAATSTANVAAAATASMISSFTITATSSLPTAASRWHNDFFRSKGDKTTARVGKWTKEEDGKLKDAAEKYNGKSCEEISALVPGRTKKLCASRWHGALDSKSDETTAHVGTSFSGNH